MNALTHRELEVLLPAIKLPAATSCGDVELPALTEGECLKYLDRLMNYSTIGPLSADERLLHRKLLEAFKHAVKASMLGFDGRFLVIDEHDVVRYVRGKKGPS